MGPKKREARPKKLRDQTIVITGASSGIGLATARMAAERGANVVLTSRNGEELRRATDQITSRAGRATYVVADVKDPAALDRVADAAIREFGGFDTWVNNAGVSIYGKLTEVPLEDKKELFETNFWGVVNGCRTAVRHLEHKGGTIINVGSIVSDRAIPLQGIYSASKHAVLGYTDALRMELEHDRLPITVTLVKPSAINTPYVEHARNYMEQAPTLPPPVYAPEVVAEAILRCAERRMREITVGGGGRMLAAMGQARAALDGRLHGAHDVRSAEGPERPGPHAGQPVPPDARRPGDRAVRRPRDEVERVHEGDDVRRDARGVDHRGRGAARRRGEAAARRGRLTAE